MPQAIEWSFATPKMSAVFPVSSPITISSFCQRMERMQTDISILYPFYQFHAKRLTKLHCDRKIPLLAQPRFGRVPESHTRGGAHRRIRHGVRLFDEHIRIGRAQIDSVPPFVNRERLR